MKHSKLSDHTFEKGELITPLNSLSMMSEFEDEKSWSYGRMPEYLWIGLILKYFGRNEGFKKAYLIVSKLHGLEPSLNAHVRYGSNQPKTRDRPPALHYSEPKTKR